MDNLAIAKKNIKLLDLIQGKKREIGKRILVNPCPKCGHKDHFFIYDYSNTFSSESFCCKGGSIIDFFVQVEGMKINEAIKKVLEMSGLNSNKKSVSEINTLKRKHIKNLEEKANKKQRFEQIYDNISCLERQLKYIENKTIDLQFLHDFCERVTFMCLEYNDENYNFLNRIKEEYFLCCRNFKNSYKNLKIIRGVFDV